MGLIIRAPGGDKKHLEDLQNVTVPDCVQIVRWLREEGRVVYAAHVLQTWHLANDLLWNMRHPTEVILANESRKPRKKGAG